MKEDSARVFVARFAQIIAGALLVADPRASSI